MARLLFNVADTFTIRGRGVVPLPGLVPIEGEVFRVGDPLRLKRPDGTALEVRIVGMNLFTGTPAVEVLLEGLSDEDVPRGTEVWSVDAPRRGDNQPLQRTGAAVKRSWFQKLIGRGPGR